jgi:hypothetical protein
MGKRTYFACNQNIEKLFKAVRFDFLPPNVNPVNKPLILAVLKEHARKN